MTTRRSASNVKVLHNGYTFTGSKSFPFGILPTKCQVLERIIQFQNFRTVDVANDVAKEIHDRWVWCNVYPLHYLTISKKVQALVVAFSKLDRYPKKKRGASFLEKEAEFLSDIDKLFDVFCNDNEQRRRLEKDHKLRMTDKDFVFYEDQKSRRIGKCLDVAWPLTSSDQKFIRRSESHVNAPTSQCQNERIFGINKHRHITIISSFSVLSGSAKSNRKKWPNLARICERYQLSDRAAAAVANSVLVDVGLVTEDDKTRIIDRSKLRRERERCRNEIRSEEQQNFGLVNAVYLDGRKDATQIVAQGPNEKHYRSVQLKEHYTVVGEPGSYYLIHFSPEDGKGRTIAQKLFDSFSGTELEGKLAIVGTDGTASMTGKHNGCIRSLEELLH